MPGVCLDDFVPRSVPLAFPQCPQYWVPLRPESGLPVPGRLREAERVRQRVRVSLGKVRKMFGKVLVVEDDDDLAGLLTARLRKAGFTVERAGNGEAGVRLTREFAPDVVLMDWMMPVKSGIEATEEIRDDPWITQPYIAMISVRSGEDDLARAELAGVDEYITKPFSPRDVLERVSAIIELRTWLSRDSAENDDAENPALAVSEVYG